MKNTKNIIVLGCVIQILCSYLSAQIKIKSINPLPMSERGFINNPVWSMDSKQIAFEFMGKNEKSKVLLYKIGGNLRAKALIQTNEGGSPFFPTSDEISSLLPNWSIKENSTLYFLYDSRRIGKLREINYDQIPILVSNIEPLSISIGQKYKTSEYHVTSIDNEEYIFIIQQDSPGRIDYTDQYDLIDLPKINNWIKKDEVIDSFTLSEGATNIIVCKGSDKNKIFIYGEIVINNYDLNIINLKTISISKTQNGVLQEPLVNPADINLIAYLEIVDNLQREFEYHLHIHKLDSKKDFLLTKGLYRNENNKITRPNSTSYVWHPNGDYIFYITTDAKRNVAYIDLKNLNQPKVNILNTGIEFAEQISISPDGKYLAVMTQIAVGEDADALGQLFIVELTY